MQNPSSTRCVLAASLLLLAACGGGGGGSADGGASPSPTPAAPAPAPAPAAPPMSARDAVRLADQASFGPSEALLAQMRTQSAAAWVQSQIELPPSSRYRSGGSSAVHVNVGDPGFCDQPAQKANAHCWRDNFSAQPLRWDFYRNAIEQPDQLRQRMAFALQQIVVVSDYEVDGSYGLRRYQNQILDEALGNYRELLKKVSLSPLMGDYLDNVNNDRAAPNENFARELLQLFALGTCELEADASLKGGRCQPTYDNAMVRNYAYALTGWTYPAGGSARWGCWPAGTNCRYLDGDMQALPALHDAAERPLLAGQKKAAGSSPAQALDAVLDSLMAHPNIAPFVSQQLIRALTVSNPSPAYVRRVAAAFDSGRYEHPEGRRFGQGRKGDLAATAAAILLDAEARGERPASTKAGKLREPVLMMTGVLRALNGRSDGDALSWWWGGELRQLVFSAPSVFNFYPPDYPVPGTAGLVGPAFGIHNANTALARLNYLTYLLDWNGSDAEPSVPNALGTRVNLDAFVADAEDAGKLVDRMALLALGHTLAEPARASVVEAVAWWTASTDKDNWQRQRVRAAAYLVFASPQYQTLR